MERLGVAVVFCCVLATAFAIKPHPSCKSGLWGPSCSDYNPCKPGYSCINKRCCRDPVCPRGWTEGPSCNLLPGQQRCPYRYECINNFCCRRPGYVGTCPPIPKARVPCLRRKPTSPFCNSNRDCLFGQICCPDMCGWKTCKKPWNPYGEPIGK